MLARDRGRLGELQWGRRVNAAEVITKHVVRPFYQLLQWGRRVNAAEVLKRVVPNEHGHHASMGPPRERGGSSLGAHPSFRVTMASMGPPRERGGSGVMR